MARIAIPMLIAVSVIVSSSAWAVNQRGSFVSRFNYSCAQLNEFHKNAQIQKDGDGVTFNRSFAVIIGWVAGYMSRVNLREEGKADFFGHIADEIGALIKWCKANPGSDLAEAMQALTKERLPKAKKPAAKPAAKAPAKPKK